MEFAADLLSALRGRVQPAGAGSATGSFDWPGLHARLSAAHAARRELTRCDMRVPIRDGGFSDWPLAAHAAPKLTPAVNLTDSTDGKQPHGMDANIAGQLLRGDRGQ